MAKEESDHYECSAAQLYERTKSRRIIPLTISADIGLSGGVPLGCTALIAGRPKSGKSSIVLQYSANAQKLYGCKIFIFPIEGRLSNQTLEQIRGLDREKVTVILPPIIEDKEGNIVGYAKWHAQQWWDKIGEILTNNPGSILIVDSISSMSSEKEQSEGMGYQGRGDGQKLEAQFCRLYGDLTLLSGSTVFLIAQVQANTSGYGPMLQIKAGNSIKHQADLVMFCKGVEKWKEEDGKIKGHDIKFTVETSALGAPSEIIIPLRYGYGVDTVRDVITNAINWQIIKKGGSWFELPFIEREGKFIYSPIEVKTEEKPEVPEEETKETEDGDTKAKEKKKVKKEKSEYFKLQGEVQIWNWFNNINNKEHFDKIESEVRKILFV